MERCKIFARLIFRNATLPYFPMEMPIQTNPFAPDFENLPENLAVFPLPGVLLLPHGQLPLNVFEPRYLAMVEDALYSKSRMIGMVQPTESTVNEITDETDIYQTGCAGKITDFSETSDGRYLITLTGICRFHIAQDHGSTAKKSGYRSITPNWEVFRNDLDVKACLDVDRDHLRRLLRDYFDAEGMSCDFSKFDDVQDGKLMTCLSMICPFEPREKQALLEQICCVERAKLFMTMLEMAIQAGKSLDPSKIQCH